MVTNKEQNKLNVPHLRFPEFHGEWQSQLKEVAFPKIKEVLLGLLVYCTVNYIQPISLK